MNITHHYIYETQFLDRIVHAAFPIRLLDFQDIKGFSYREIRKASKHHSVKGTQTTMAVPEIFLVSEILSI